MWGEKYTPLGEFGFVGAREGQGGERGLREQLLDKRKPVKIFENLKVTQFELQVISDRPFKT